MTGGELAVPEDDGPEIDLGPVVSAFAELGRLLEGFSNDLKVALSEITGAPTPTRHVTSERVDE